MSARIEPTIVFMRGFLWPPAMISSAETIGTPDFIMVAIWRLKNAMSFGVMALPAWPKSGLDLGLTTLGVMPWRRSSARSMLAFLAACSPFIFTPRLSVPSQTKGTSWLVARSTGTVGFRAAVRDTDMIRISPAGIPMPARTRMVAVNRATGTRPGSVARRSGGDGLGQCPGAMVRAVGDAERHFLPFMSACASCGAGHGRQAALG